MPLRQWMQPTRPQYIPVKIYLVEIDKLKIMSIFDLMASRYFL